MTRRRMGSSSTTRGTAEVSSRSSRVCALLLCLAAPACQGNEEIPRSAEPTLCVFDYDLTLSSNKCAATVDRPEMHCRVPRCATYDWHGQCLGVDAREAIAECVRRGAWVGIASHADADTCWSDKVTPMVSQRQFPEWTESSRYDSTGEGWRYPALDDRANWNCRDCAYNMDGSVPKPEGIARAMRHYGLNPASATDRSRVIFWDDSTANIKAVRSALPGVTAVRVPRNASSGSKGGCGITQAQIDEGWREHAAAR